MTPEIKNIKDKLNVRAKEVVKMLLPNGVQNGNHVKVGNINGESGESMAVYIEGEKTGRFTDFATGEYGDLIDLWMFAKGMPEFQDAIEDIKGFLGITSNYVQPKKKSVDISVETKKTGELNDNMIKYLTETRKLSPQTIKDFKLRSDKGKIIFPFYHEQQVKMHKILKVKNSKNEWGMNKGEKESVLFGWQAIKNTDRSVVITEGELDAMSYHDQGIPALSVPNGGGPGKVNQFIENEHARLMNHFNTFYISMDMDSAGDEMLPNLIKVLGAANCRIVSLPKLESGKKSDANECHKEGIDLKYYLKTAKYQDIPGIINCIDAFGDAMKIFNGEVDSIGQPLPWAKYVDKFRFRPSEMTIWGGYNSSGKSMVLNHTMIHMGMMGHKSLIASFEMSKGRTMYRLMRQANSGSRPTNEMADCVGQYLSNHVWLVDSHGTVKQKELLEKFSYAIARYNITHLVIDPLAKCGMREDDYPAQKEFVERLTDFVHQHEVHVHLVAHSRKGEKDDSRADKMSLKGSGGMADMTYNVLTMNKNIKKKKLIDSLDEGMTLDDFGDDKEKMEKILKKPDFYLDCGKQRNGEWEGTINLWLDNKTLQFKQSEDESPFQYVNYSKLEN